MMLARNLYRIAVAALAGMVAPSLAAALTFTPLGDLAGGDHDSTANGISADGTVVVGTGNDALDTQAFRWVGGTMTGLGDFPGGTDASFGYATDADGSRVVGQGSTVDPGLEAFRWDTPVGPMTGLGHIDGSPPLNSVAFGVSADGSVIVGESNSASGFQAFIWDAGGGMRALDPIAGQPASSAAYDVSGDGSVVVGIAAKLGGPNDSAAVMWTNEGSPLELGTLAGGNNYSIALGVSSDGTTAVGSASSATSQGSQSGALEAFRWTSVLSMEGLGDLDGGIFDSVAHAASADGSVIVGRGTTAAGHRAFIWTEQAGMLDLNVVAASVLPANWQFEEAFDISDDGLAIVGRCSNADGNNEACMLTLDAAPIPEPGTAALLALGLLGLAARRR